MTALPQAAASAPIWTDRRPILRFLTAGDVDDGKSTLIGRLLFDAKAVTRDQIAAARGRDAQGAQPDFARLLDGLEAEAEQGITIDAAYRYFATPERKFIIADAPGHEQYTRNMITAASTADLAVVLVDALRARDGLTVQTRRHLAIAGLMGLPVILAVNKMDLAGYDAKLFRQIGEAARAYAGAHHVPRFEVLPVVALSGENVLRASPRLDWFNGPTLIEALTRAPARAQNQQAPLRLPVQRVVRLDGASAKPFRGFAGRIESGSLSLGARLRVAGSSDEATAVEILSMGQSVTHAPAGSAVTVRLSREIDLSRGEVLAGPEGAECTHGLAADVCWLSQRPALIGRRFLLKQATRVTNAILDAVIASEAGGTGGTLEQNGIARVRLRTSEPVLADLYAQLPATGSFILIDPQTHETAAGGFIRAVFDPSAEDGDAGEGI